MKKMHPSKNKIVTVVAKGCQDKDGVWHKGTLIDYYSTAVVIVDTPTCKHILNGERVGYSPSSYTTFYIYVQYLGRQQTLKYIYTRRDESCDTRDKTTKAMLNSINAFIKNWIPRYVIDGLDLYDTRGMDRKAYAAAYYQKNKDRLKAYKQEVTKEKQKEYYLSRKKYILTDADKQKQKEYRAKKREEKLNRPDGHK